MAAFETDSQDPDEVVRLFKAWEAQMRPLRKVTVGPDETVVEDLNRERMRFRGVTFGSPALVALFRAIGMQSDPKHLEAPPPNQTSREWRVTARYPWGQDRIL